MERDEGGLPGEGRAGGGSGGGKKGRGRQEDGEWRGFPGKRSTREWTCEEGRGLREVEAPFVDVYRKPHVPGLNWAAPSPGALTTRLALPEGAPADPQASWTGVRIQAPVGAGGCFPRGRILTPPPLHSPVPHTGMEENEVLCLLRDPDQKQTNLWFPEGGKSMMSAAEGVVATTSWNEVLPTTNSSFPTAESPQSS